ncbi:unnamed protein product [Arctogadus glacialis]
MKVFSLLYLLLVLVALLASVSSVRPEESYISCIYDVQTLHAAALQSPLPLRLMRKNEVVKSLAGAALGRKVPDTRDQHSDLL